MAVVRWNRLRSGYGGRMDAREVAVAVAGGVLGGIAVLSGWYWWYVMRCERYSEKGFGE